MEMGQNSKYALDKYLPSAEWKCGVGVSWAERLHLLFYRKREKMHIGGLPESDTQCRKVNVSPSLKGPFFLSRAEFQRKLKEKIHWVISEKIPQGKSNRNKPFRMSQMWPNYSQTNCFLNVGVTLICT